MINCNYTEIVFSPIRLAKIKTFDNTLQGWLSMYYQYKETTARNDHIFPMGLQIGSTSMNGNYKFINTLAIWHNS